jgi:hypothetical protein
MKCGVVSSATLFGPNLNPGHRIDASFGLSLGAIESGRIDVLRSCFDDLFTRPAYAKDWWCNFRKCKTWEEAEERLLQVYGITGIAKEKLPQKFREGMAALLRELLTENLQELQAESQVTHSRIQQLKVLLEPKSL